jgi:formate dehydrogenase subunit delta
MNIDRLAVMANDISTFFAAESPPQRAAEDVAQHLRRFWEPRMRRQIIAHLREHGGGGLEPPARCAVRRWPRPICPAREPCPLALVSKGDFS